MPTLRDLLKKKSKYRNQKTVVDNITFDSKKEAARYGILKLMERNGEISNLRLQVPYKLVVNGHHVSTYRCDFEYERGKQTITEDVKSEATRKLPLYKLKKKLMLALFKINIAEV